jgi:hypothetical protein
MTVNFNKPSHIFFFGIAIPLASWFISQSFFNVFQNWPTWLEGPSPFAIYGIIFFLFDKYGWQWKIFRKLGIVWFPNLNGRWKGTQQSSYIENGKNIQVDGKLEVTQTFSKICVRGYYNKSDSESIAASFAECNDQVYLFYTYDNDPSSLKTGTMQKHKGSAKIKLLPTENKIRGCYWNSIGNYGEMDYELEQKQLLGRF